MPCRLVGQAIIWTNAGILLNGPWGINFSEILINILYILIQENAFENVVWDIVAILTRPQCVNIWDGWSSFTSDG